MEEKKREKRYSENEIRGILVAGIDFGYAIAQYTCPGKSREELAREAIKKMRKYPEIYRREIGELEGMIAVYEKEREQREEKN